MPARILFLGLIVALAGCASEATNHSLSIQSAMTTTSASMLGGPVSADAQADDLKRASRQTMAAKMLAAIALERVTGRTPDPSRFNELR